MKPDLSLKTFQSRRGWIPYFVLAIALLLTTGITTYVAMTAKAKDRLRFESVVHRTQNDIQDRLETYIALLRASSGLFAASDQVSLEEFRAFTNRLRLREHYSGIQGIGFSVRVSPETKDGLIANMQQQGIENFNIRPNYLRPEYHSIIYLEPLDQRNRAAIGFDMFTSSVRRQAMERARDTGSPAASGKVTLLQEIERQKQAGFLVYVPVYRNGSIPDTVQKRRAALLGFVYSPFRASDLMQGIFGSEKSSNVDFQIYDGKKLSPENLLHRSSRSSSQANNPSYRPHHSTTSTIQIAGRPWSIVFTSRPEFELTAESRLVPLVAFAGVAMSLILLGVVSSLVRARNAAERSEERFRKLAEKARVIPWEADAITGDFTYVGPQTVEILGYPTLDWYTKNFWAEHIHPEDQKWAIKYCQDQSVSLDNYEFEYRMLAADGRIVWLYDIVNVVRGKDGPQLLRGFIIDITERKQAEAEREQLLRREQAAREEAERANRMKDEFLAILSHELRTPLNAMLGWTQLLRTRQMNEATTTRALETIDRNSKSLSQLIEDVLDMSQIVTGKVRLRVSKVELVPTIEAAIETVLPAAQAKEIRIESVLDPAVRPILGDANRLKQVFWNLLSNAVKFTPKGGRVEIQLKQIDSWLQIKVSDNGQGISSDFLPHVFDRFRQADSSTTRTHGGLGLGLAIVRHIVELHGGSVQAESQGLGKGATFTVSLPVKAAADALSESEQERSPRDSERAIAPLALDGLRVLVVDDEADARDILTKVLAQYGAQVITAATAREALATMREFQPNVLVSDIGMPEEDGYSLIRQVRALQVKQGGQIPAVALTAYAGAEDQKQALSAGFQLHVPKPVNPYKLVMLVSELAERNISS